MRLFLISVLILLCKTAKNSVCAKYGGIWRKI
nr:MAG TPA: hypothetical protein [Caudoviricetes sp.]